MKSEQRSRRGRPVGTGLDDRSRLAAIRELMASDPTLKPTTAIKMIGVTEPSAVRRLREKLKDAQHSPRLSKPAKGTRTAHARPLSNHEPTIKSPPRSQSAPSIPAKSAHPSTTVSNSEFDTWFTFWCSLALQGFNTTSELQHHCTKLFMESPAATFALGQHVASTEFALALSRERRRSRK